MQDDHSLDIRPRPDPTLLTTSQLHREMEWIKSLLQEHVTTEQVQLTERKDLFLKLFSSGDALINERIDGVLRELTLMSDAAKVAVAKSEFGYEKRFEAMNEFRGQMADQAAHFISAAESKAMYNAIQEKLSDLSERMTRNEGRGTGQSEGKGELKSNVVAGVGLLVGLISLFMFLNNLSSNVDKNTASRIRQSETPALTK